MPLRYQKFLFRGADFGDTTKGGFAHWYARIPSAGIFTNAVHITSTVSTRNSASLLTFAAASASTPAAPAAPTNLIASAVSSNQVDLSWTTSGGAASYNVKRSTVSGGPYTTVASGITGTTYSDTGLAEGTTYYYIVSALNAGGESAGSIEASATTSYATLPAVGVSINGGALTLSWPNKYTGWTLQYSTNLMSTNTWIPIPDTDLTNVFNFGTITNNTLYFKLVYP